MPAWLSALTPSPEESRRGLRGEGVEREMREREGQGKGGGRGREGINRVKERGCDLLFSSNSPREIFRNARSLSLNPVSTLSTLILGSTRDKEKKKFDFCAPRNPVLAEEGVAKGKQKCGVSAYEIMRKTGDGSERRIKSAREREANICRVRYATTTIESVYACVRAYVRVEGGRRAA